MLISFGLDQENVRELQALWQTDEEILWVDRPGTGAFFRMRDLLITPVGVVLSLAYLWWFFFSGDAFDPDGLVSPKLLAFPFIVVIVYNAIGAFFVKRWLNKRTIYGITDRSAVITVGVPFFPRIRSVSLRDLSYVDREVFSDGSGSIIFSDRPDRPNWFTKNVHHPFAKRREEPLTFKHIKSASRVYELVARRREELARERPYVSNR